MRKTGAIRQMFDMLRVSDLKVMNSERVRKLINQLFLHSVRKTHCAGRKHKENVKFYYQKWMEDQVGSISFRF